MKYDIAIVGGGLIGASMACALSKIPGLRICVIEARDEIPQDQRALSLAYSSVQIFRALGLWGLLEPHATPIKQIHVSEQGRFGSTRFSAQQQSVAALGYVVKAQDLLTTLVDVAKQKSNISWLAPAVVNALTLNTNHAELQINTETGEQQLQAELVIAADGSFSKLRDMAGIKYKTHDYQQHALVTPINLARGHQFTAYERFTPQGPLAMVPFKEKVSTLIWMDTPARVKQLIAEDDDAFLQQAQKAFGYRLGKFVGVGRRVSFPLTKIIADEQIKPHFVLLGNSAHTLHPIAAQGFNLGLRDAAFLFDEIVEAFAAEQSFGDIDVLKRYQEKSQTAQQQTARLTDRTVNIFSSSILAFPGLRSLGLIGSDILKPIKNLIAKRSMGTGGRLSKLACGIEVES